jgi:succinate dehydrogenase hydrophobic anchor subunit
MTTSGIEFAQGKILESFNTQPAAALLCVLLVISAILAFLTTCFGVYFVFVDNFFSGRNIKYIILALLIIIAAGWAVTLARALAAKGH